MDQQTIRQHRHKTPPIFHLNVKHEKNPQKQKSTMYRQKLYTYTSNYNIIMYVDML